MNIKLNGYNCKQFHLALDINKIIITPSLEKVICKLGSKYREMNSVSGERRKIVEEVYDCIIKLIKE